MKEKISDKIYPFWMRKTQKLKIKEILKRIPPRGKVLDVACGPGFLEELVNDEIVAIDINPEYVAETKRKNPKCLAIVGDANELNFPDNTFDLIYAIDVIHLLDAERFFNRVKSVLKTNGKIVLTTFCNRENCKEREKWLKGIVKNFSFNFIDEFVVKAEEEWDFCLVLTPRNND